MTKILVMGTLPSDLSLKHRQYYANPANDFWRLIGAALNQNIETLPYDARLAVLKSNRIGLWDAYHNCVLCIRCGRGMSCLTRTSDKISGAG